MLLLEFHVLSGIRSAFRGHSLALYSGRKAMSNWQTGYVHHLKLEEMSALRSTIRGFQCHCFENAETLLQRLGESSLLSWRTII